MTDQPATDKPVKAKFKRKAVSKKDRFDVFKRDNFACQYCGAHPPNVLLHVDHIRPVADGGDNDFDNLVTACESCNLGKGARSLECVPQSLAEKAVAVAERESQLLGYQEVLEQRRQRIEEELWRVAEELDPGCSEGGMQRDRTASIRRFNERLGVHAVFEAATLARAKFPYGGKKTFLYFCGICWNLVRTADGGGV